MPSPPISRKSLTPSPSLSQIIDLNNNRSGHPSTIAKQQKASRRPQFTGMQLCQRHHLRRLAVQTQLFTAIDGAKLLFYALRTNNTPDDDDDYYL